LSRTPEQSSENPPTLKVMVIGNSNSVMRGSYVRVLEKIPRFDVRNKSIGSSPNVVLLDYLALEQDWNYDFVIIETAVVDFIQSTGAYTEERSAETLELFIRFVRARSNAEIIIFTIPTRLALLAPGSSWQESLYQGIADRFGVPILDGFRLVRGLVGRQKAAMLGFFGSRASRLVQAFGLGRNIATYIAWRGMRDSQLSSNALGTFGFVDHVHLSPALHALAGTLLAEYMTLTGRCAVKCAKLDRPDLPPTVIAANPQGDRQVARTSSLVSRDMIRLVHGESARYQCPPGFFVYGIMMNSASTCCFLRLGSPAGVTTLDLHFPPGAMTWIGIVTAILDPVGDGDIVATVLDQPDAPDLVRTVPNTTSVCETPLAEIGELILVRRDWRDILPFSEDCGRQAFQIDLAPWAGSLIAAATLSAAQTIDGIEVENRRVEAECFKAAANLLSNLAVPLSSVDRARVMLLLGMTDGLTAFVERAAGQDPNDGELERIQALLRELKAEDDVRPKDLLERAYGLARSGAILQADRVFADGMARFPGEIIFFMESAWIPYRLKDWTEAKRRWQNVIDWFPNHPASYLGMVHTLSGSGDISGARDVLAIATSLFPDNTDVAKHNVRPELEEIASGTP
jgi:hypothetical protein